MPQNLPALDITIVFGEGPVKPVLLLQELTSAQRETWASFKRKPLVHAEPDFYVIEGRAYLDVLDSIDARQDLQSFERARRLRQTRSSWQRIGRLALKRMGRQNALAAGDSLVQGLTARVLLTGGHTMPSWADVDPETWPSEAELMADVIRRNFGDRYIEKYEQAIDTVLDIEPVATNTLENIVLSINRFPYLTDGKTQVGLLTAHHHLARCTLIAEMFLIKVATDARISAQRALLSRAVGLKHPHYRHLYEGMELFKMDVERNPWLQDLARGELRYIRGLTENEYLSYWVGYIFKLDNPALIQTLVDRIMTDPGKAAALANLAAKVGFDPAQFRRIDFEQLAVTNHQGYLETKRRLELLTRHRAMPPAASVSLPDSFLASIDAG